MRAAELERYLDPTLSLAGFRLSAIEDPMIYQDRPAWAIYFLSDDCKLQICWSAREGGIEYLPAPLDAPDEFGLTNQSKKWRLMLVLSTACDDLVTPALGANGQVEMPWLKALFELHIGSARASLLASNDVVTRMTSDETFNLNEAVALYLKRYPGKNDHEFDSHYGSAGDQALKQVKLVLREATEIAPDWNRMSLNDAGDYVESVMRERHPGLSSKALEAIGNYYTFLMR